MEKERSLMKNKLDMVQIYEDEIKKLERDLMKSKNIVNEYGKEIWMLRNKNKVDVHYKKTKVIQSRNVKRD